MDHELRKSQEKYVFLNKVKSTSSMLYINLHLHLFRSKLEFSEIYTCKVRFFSSPRSTAGLYASVCLSVCLFVCHFCRVVAAMHQGCPIRILPMENFPKWNIWLRRGLTRNSWCPWTVAVSLFNNSLYWNQVDRRNSLQWHTLQTSCHVW